MRNCDEFSVTRKDVNNIIEWEEKRGKNVEIPFKPARVILQDLTLVIRLCVQLWLLARSSF